MFKNQYIDKNLAPATTELRCQLHLAYANLEPIIWKLSEYLNIECKDPGFIVNNLVQIKFKFANTLGILKEHRNNIVHGSSLNGTLSLSASENSVMDGLIACRDLTTLKMTDSDKYIKNMEQSLLEIAKQYLDNNFINKLHSSKLYILDKSIDDKDSTYNSENKELISSCEKNLKFVDNKLKFVGNPPGQTTDGLACQVLRPPQNKPVFFYRLAGYEDWLKDYKITLHSGSYNGCYGRIIRWNGNNVRIILSDNKQIYITKNIIITYE